MPKEKYSFYNIPRKYTAVDYQEALNFIIKKYSKINGLMSIYNWGGPFTPGISDLDLVFVFDKSKVKPMPFFKRIFHILNDKFRYIARHPFFYIDNSSFKDIKYIYPDAEFKLIYGKSLKINKITVNDDYFAKIALLSDIIVRHYPRDFIEQAMLKSVNARDMLLRLNSLRHSIRTIELLTKSRNRQWDYKMRQVEELRKNWFKKSNFGLLASLNEDAIEISVEMAEKFRNFLVENKIAKIISGDKVEYYGLRNNTLFIKNWGKERAINEMLDAIRGKRQFFSILPLELAPQQIEYSKHNGFISSYVKEKLSHNLKYKLKYQDIIEKRAVIFNNQAKLAFKLKHSDFVAFFDFGYRNKAGINNIVMNLIRSYRN